MQSTKSINDGSMRIHAELSSEGKKNLDYVVISLVLVLVVGFILRIWGIRFGLPHVYNVDEPFEVYRALRLGMGDFEYSLFGRIVKSGYYYLLFVEYAIYYLLMLMLGVIGSSQEFAYSIVRDPSSIWTIGRVTTAIIGTINIYIVYLIGHRIHGPIVGLFSSFLLAVAYMHVAHSHYITVDIPLTCIVSLTLYYAIRIFQSESEKEYVKAGLFGGLASVIKLPGIIVLVPILIAHYLRMKKEGGSLLCPTFAKRLGIVVASFAVVYVLLNPAVLWTGGSMVWRIVVLIFGLEPDSALKEVIRAGVEKDVNHWLFYVQSLVDGLGFPVFVCSVFGLVRGLYSKRGEYIILGAFILSFYLSLSIVQDPILVYSRYVLPLLPPMVVFASILVADLISYLNPSKEKGVAIAGFLLVALSIPGVQQSINYDMLRTRKDTRTMAKEWVESNIPPDTKIFLEGNPEAESALVVPLENTVENILQMSKRLQASNPGKARFLRMRADVYERRGYDLITVRHFEPYKEWEFYRRMGLKVIIRTGKWQNNGPEVSSEANPVAYSRIKFDQELHADKNVKIAALFDPKKLNRPGRYLRIYQVVD